MRLVLVGAGPVGIAAVEAAVEDGLASRVDVVDRDRSALQAGTMPLSGPLQGQAVTDVDDLDPVEGAPDPAGAPVAVLAFSSDADAVADLAVTLLGRGFHVVTTCENLARPSGERRAALVDAAEAADRVVVVTGANPGFVMDRLPALLLGATRRIRRVVVTRHLDSRQRRGPLVAKTGRGLTVEEFTAGHKQGRIGHAGLGASLQLMADVLGWQGDDDHGYLVSESIRPRTGPDGRVTGLHQTAEFEIDDGRALVLDLVMAADVERSVDRIEIEGDPPLTVEIRGGFHGDSGTTARVVAAVRAVATLPPGFYGPLDLPVRF